jgi:hypothetical protein
MELCGKLCPLGHPCGRMCFEECKCDFVVPRLRLRCGHEERDVAWYDLLSGDEILQLTPFKSSAARRPSAIVCKATVQRMFPTCEHSIALPCHKDISQEICSAPCSKEMECCSRKCKAKCHACQRLGHRRKQHVAHSCDKTLHCQHVCKDPCVAGHQCSCTEPCRQVCDHSRCGAGCAKSCTPCAEKCTWTCEHHTCPVSCSLVSVTLRRPHPSYIYSTAMHKTPL